jgi:hypothetical protein
MTEQNEEVLPQNINESMNQNINESSTTSKEEKKDEMADVQVKYEVSLQLDNGFTYKNPMVVAFKDLEKLKQNFLAVFEKREGFFNFLGSTKSYHDITAIPVNRVVIMEIKVLEMFKKEVETSA